MAITHAVRPTQRGFTLMEIMISVAIVGILAAIALPNYSDYVTRSKLIDATTKLGDFRSKMEKYFMDNRRYSTAVGSGLCGIPNIPAGKADYFKIDCVAGPLDTTYTITATGNKATGMPANTWLYTVDQTNAKASSGPAGWNPGVGCWAVRKDGSC